MGLVLKLVGNTWENASRDKRELSVFCELGYDVLVMAKGNQNDWGRQDQVDGYSVLRYSTRPLGSIIPVGINRFVSLFTWAHAVRELKADVISAHDLRPCLIIAWLSTWFQKKKPKLIYDSHEFELGRNTGGRRSRLQTLVIGKAEKFLMKRCALSVMVNDSIADEVQRIHKLKERPLVIRNIPEYWRIDPEVCSRTRQELLECFGVPFEEKPFLMMYHGGVLQNRGIEQSIEAVRRTDGAGLVILGNGQTEYLAELHQLAVQQGVEKRVLFHEAVPHSELWKYIGAVDLSLILLPAEIKSYYYALPNKLFESIQSETPILASNFPEMKRIVDQYQIGMTCDSDDGDSIHACIEMIWQDAGMYAGFKRNIRKAKDDLCWEHEKEKLKNILKRLDV